MPKKGITYFIIFIFFLSILNIFLYYNQGFGYNSLSGMFVTEIPTITNKTEISKILFFAQWVVIGIVILISVIIGLKHRKEEKHAQIHYNEIKEEKGKFGTDLDVFYKILKKRKKLKLKIISTIFKISKDNALEWGKILENQNLAVIEYPVFGDPEVIVKETEEEIIEREKNKKEEKINHVKEKEKK